MVKSIEWYTVYCFCLLFFYESDLKDCIAECLMYVLARKMLRSAIYDNHEDQKWICSTSSSYLRQEEYARCITYGNIRPFSKYDRV